MTKLPKLIPGADLYLTDDYTIGESLAGFDWGPTDSFGDVMEPSHGPFATREAAEKHMLYHLRRSPDAVANANQRARDAEAYRRSSERSSNA